LGVTTNHPSGTVRSFIMPPNERLPVVDLGVLLAYLAAMVAMGWWFGRRARGADQFMAAGGKIPAWAVGLSIFGTFVSSISFLALPGKAYATDWSAFVFSLVIAPAAWIAVRWFVPFYRRGKEVSAYDHLGKRFGPWARNYAVGCYMLTQVARTGVILYLLALALAPLTGWDIHTLVLVGGGAVLLYSVIGGMEAVIWTDVVQSVIFIGGSLACVLVLLAGLPDGPVRAARSAVSLGKLSLGDPALDFTRATVWVIILQGLVVNLRNFGIDQSYVQRYATARDDGAARRSVWLGAGLYIPVSAMFFMTGTLLYLFYRAHPEWLMDGSGAAPKADEVFPRFIATRLPVGLGGLVLAAVFAAAQSTISGSLNGCATLWLCDVHRRYINPATDDQGGLRVLRLATVVCGVLGTLAAWALISFRNTPALDLWWALEGVLTSGLLGLFLLGRSGRRVTATAAAAGVTAGTLLTVWLVFSPLWPDNFNAWKSSFHILMAPVLATMTILLVGGAVALVTRPATQNSAKEI